MEITSYNPASGVQMVDIGSIAASDINPRHINDDDLDRLCQSLRDNPDLFRARPLILSDRTGKLVVIAGNQRYRAAMKIGLKTVPCYIFHAITSDREREIMLRDNINNGRWDIERLRIDFGDLPIIDYGLDLPLVDIPTIEPVGDLGGSNYVTSTSKTTVPQNILGVGGLVPRELMEAVRDKLLRHGADPDEDNGEMIAEIYRKWL